MATRKSSHAEVDRLMTITVLFIDKHSGTYRTRAGLRARIEAYLDNEYRDDLAWLDRVNDMDTLVDLVAKSGGVVMVEMPPLGGSEKKLIAEKREN